MTEAAGPAVDESRKPSLSEDLLVVADSFDLGEVIEAPQYLTDGLMNRNWRIGTARGRFAVKQLIDVPLEAARRNLRTLSALAADGVPVCTPLTSGNGDPVAEVGERGYCVVEWVEGVHVPGTELALGQVADLGEHLGRIRDRLRVRPYAEEVTRTAQVQFGVAGVFDLERVRVRGRLSPSLST